MTRWVATSLGTTPILPGTTIDVVFGEDNKLAGTAGCNRYSAACTIDGERVTVGPAVATRMYCGAPEGIMEQEAAYFAALQKAKVSRVVDGRLQLGPAAGVVTLVYEAE